MQYEWGKSTKTKQQLLSLQGRKEQEIEPLFYVGLTDVF